MEEEEIRGKVLSTYIGFEGEEGETQTDESFYLASSISQFYLAVYFKYFHFFITRDLRIFLPFFFSYFFLKL